MTLDLAAAGNSVSVKLNGKEVFTAWTSSEEDMAKMFDEVLEHILVGR